MLSTIMEIVQVPSIKYCTAFIFKTILFTAFPYSDVVLPVFLKLQLTVVLASFRPASVQGSF